MTVPPVMEPPFSGAIMPDSVCSCYRASSVAKGCLIPMRLLSLVLFSNKPAHEEMA